MSLKPLILLVGGTGIEPATPSMSKIGFAPEFYARGCAISNCLPAGVATTAASTILKLVGLPCLLGASELPPTSAVGRLCSSSLIPQKLPKNGGKNVIGV